MKRRSFIAGMLAAPIAAQLPANPAPIIPHMPPAPSVAFTHRAVTVGYLTMADLSVLDALRLRASDNMLVATGLNVFAEPDDA